MQIAIKSFLWVSAAYDDPGAPAWQIDIIETAETMQEAQAIGGITRVRLGLNMAQAIELGLDLSAIGAALNIEALARVAALEAQIATLTAPLEA